MLAATLKAPYKEFAVNADEEAIPSLFVTTDTELVPLPVNTTLGPEVGASKSTVIPETGEPMASVTATLSGDPYEVSGLVD